MKEEEKQMKKKSIWTGLLLMLLLCTVAMGRSVSAANKTSKAEKWVIFGSEGYGTKETGKKVEKASKAPVLKRGKTVQGMVFLDDKISEAGTAGLYKIQIPKASKVTMNIKLYAAYTPMFLANMYVALYDSKGRALRNGEYKKGIFTSYVSGEYSIKLKAGTYYVAVKKIFANEGSGCYRIQWK